jgi:hypothetical protein
MNREQRNYQFDFLRYQPTHLVPYSTVASILINGVCENSELKESGMFNLGGDLDLVEYGTLLF